MSTLGQILKKLRSEKEGNLTQKDVAAAIGYTRDTYANWEIGRGQPDNNALKALSLFFNCSTDYILGLSDFKRPDLIIDAAASKTKRDYDKPLSEETHKIIEDAVQYALKKYGISTSGGINDDDINKPGGKA